MCYANHNPWILHNPGWLGLAVQQSEECFLSIFGGAGHGSMAGRIQGCSNACFACVYTVKGRAPLMRGAFSLGLCPDKDFKPSV